jgi:hypothetical protein
MMVWTCSSYKENNKNIKMRSCAVYYGKTADISEVLAAFIIRAKSRQEKCIKFWWRNLLGSGLFEERVGEGNNKPNFRRRGGGRRLR